ncbi:hypothetical protein EDE04_1605 [Streptomyces sp. 2132.2]|nr:hypothetical protein [Streptomyces sp. 2132.2]ROQ95164.1 hypothetical protein EDE04_1605 [Streptomyces sp. 2132.2]
MVTPQIARGRLLMLVLFVAAVVMTGAAAVAALVRYVPQWLGS